MIEIDPLWESMLNAYNTMRDNSPVQMRRFEWRLTTQVARALEEKFLFREHVNNGETGFLIGWPIVPMESDTFLVVLYNADTQSGLAINEHYEVVSHDR